MIFLYMNNIKILSINYINTCWSMMVAFDIEAWIGILWDTLTLLEAIEDQA